MTYHFVFFLFLFIFLQITISCLRVYFVGNNLMFTSFNISDVNSNNTFYIVINGTACFHSESLALISVNESYSIFNNGSFILNNCSNLTMNTSTINNNEVQISYAISLNYASNYTIYLVINATNSLTNTFLSPSGKSDVVNNVAIVNKVDSGYLRVDWSVPFNSNGEILAYYTTLSNASGSCLYKWLMLCTGCQALTIGNQDTPTPAVLCRYTYNVSFNNTSQRLYIDSNNSLTVAATMYNIQIVPVNGYGWGSILSKNYTTEQYISEPVRNLNMTSNYLSQTITVTWIPPRLSYGDILRYVLWVNDSLKNGCIGWLAVNVSSNISQTVGTKRDPGITTSCLNITDNATFKDMTSVTIVYRSIAPCTLYIVSVVAVNGYGWGNISSTSSMTTQCAVRSFICSKETFNTFSCSWMSPINSPGPILNYNITCKNETIIYTDTLSPNVSWKMISDNVIPDVNYTCEIQACTTVDCRTSTIASTTIMIGPQNYPSILNISNAQIIMFSKESQSTSSQISITLPYGFVTETLGRIVNFSLVVVVSSKGNISNSSDYYPEKTYQECDKGKSCPYVINLPFPDSSSRQKRAANTVGRTWPNTNFTIGDNGNCSTGVTCNGPLEPNSNYLIGFRACTSGGCLVIVIYKNTAISEMIAVICVVVVIAILVTFGVICLVIYLRRRKGKNSDQNSLIPSKYLESTEVNNFEEYYSSIMKDSCEGASVQFSELDQKCTELERKNKILYVIGTEKKDRYNNIKPYQHNVVQLNGSDGYINASRICMKHFSIDMKQQCTCTNCYIVTQGPIGNSMENKVPTIADFWIMTLRNDVRIIINLTKCVESYKEKCAQYWPEEVGVKVTYVSNDHSVDVTLLSTVSNKVFDERIFTISMNGKERSVTQLHFTAWPDHSCPNSDDFLEFYDVFNTLRDNEDSVIVHCSAGVGRSGTFVLIDLELRKIVSPLDKIEIFNTLLTLRQCRCLMVQTEKQYIFAHTIILKYLKRKGLLSREGKMPNGKHSLSQNTFSNPSFE